MTPCYFFSFSNEGFITRINETLLKHLNYTAEEVTDKKKLEDLLTVGSRIFFQTHFYPLIRMRGAVNEIFLSFQSKDGGELPVLLNVFLENEGDAFEIHCGGMQISQRNKFEKEILEAKSVAEKALLENEELLHIKNMLQENQETLEQQFRELSRVNQQHNEINKVLSHDLQEPLRKVSMFASKLLSDYDNNDVESVKKNCNKISELIHKLRKLLQGLQRFNSLDERKLTFSKIDLNSLVPEAAAKVIEEEKSHCQIDFDVNPCVSFQADHKLMIIVFSELISNSIKFRNPNAETLKITVGCEEIEQNIFLEMEHKYRYEPFVRVTYSDNGTGFNAHMQDVFRIFKKAHHIDSIGMGLAYCKRILEKHGGSISVASKEGEGTKFTILIPI